ncbi:RNA pseudouridine synthase, RluA family [Geotalea daltonii FRC-32]|uniref:RNA pseudouridine synthase, RluA family n=1 Tax=Geotalea daltonii (strain DSM 22248 / JCM 15807 / FRC-32) TaxID=316067 RepID=B9M693_GEODF|nr:RluA family pseudouridine synthase [Geotalea daltonii]ACM21881.1 RNA pseudouridine synthase, RluA family [Geotalea daltonii FRC-32]
MLEFKVSAADHCRQLEGFLHVILPDASPSYVRKLASSVHVRVNDHPAESSSVLCLEDVITIKESGKTKALLRSVRPDLEILFEDTWIVVFNKPPGLPMHRAAEVDDVNLVDVGSRLLNRRDGGNGKLRPVNRLDRGTSGAVILAKSSTAAGMFGRQLKEDGLDKLYLAIVDGRLQGEGTITVPLGGKEAETRYKTLFNGLRHALVAVYPITGRMHQIRLHFKSIGHPICGDVRYGGSILNELRGHALHSFRSSIIHPATGESVKVFAPLPEDFLQVVKSIAGEEYIPILQALSDLP